MTDTYEDLPPPLRRAAETHGRGMVALVYNSGMATEAAERLARRADAEGQAALRMIAQAFNETSTALARAEGWTLVMLTECEQMIEVDFAQAAAPRLVGADGRVL